MHWLIFAIAGRTSSREIRTDVQQYAGHSDINTTKEYYLSVQDADAKAARRAQKKLLGE